MSKDRQNETSYDSQDDIENLLRVSQKSAIITTENLKEGGDVKMTTSECSHSQLIASPNNIPITANPTSSDFDRLRMLNSLSIIMLFTSFYSLSFSKVNNKYYFAVDYLKQDDIQTEINMLILDIAFLIVSVSLLLSLLRNIVTSTNQKDPCEYDWKQILIAHFRGFYFSGNILFSLCLIANHTKILQKWGFSFFLCLATLIVYFKAYYDHKKREKNIIFGGWFNFISLSVNISFLLAWNAAYLTITCGDFLIFFNFSSKVISTVHAVLQSSLTMFSILFIAYFRDIYFCTIVFIFQVGNTFNTKWFNVNFRSLIENFSDDSNINLILTSFTGICLLWSLIFLRNREEKDHLEEDINELHKKYISEKTERNIL